MPRAESITINYHAVIFTGIIALLTPLVFALLPAFRTAFASDAETLKPKLVATLSKRAADEIARKVNAAVVSHQRGE